MEGVFNFDKAINAVLYIVKHLKRADFHKVFKILYFSDRNMLSMSGMMITGDTYIAMNDGPVPSNMYDILKSVRGDGYFKDLANLAAYVAVENWDIVVAKKEPDMGKLSRMTTAFNSMVICRGTKSVRNHTIMHGAAQPLTVRCPYKT